MDTKQEKKEEISKQDGPSEKELKLASLGFAIWKWNCTWQLTSQLIQQIEIQAPDKKEISYTFPMAVTTDWRNGLRAALAALKKEFFDQSLLDKSMVESDLKFFNRPDVALMVHYQNGSTALTIKSIPLSHLTPDDKAIEKCKLKGEHFECGKVELADTKTCYHTIYRKLNLAKTKKRVYCSKECMDMDENPTFEQLTDATMGKDDELEFAKLALSDRRKKEK
ncbi:MAG TPA: hypothetical protein VMR76_02905 [Candidatus Saccharimonadia bacterium]|nr:hypothetical protein [Candidatus Saccharimonadia bacterium]